MPDLYQNLTGTEALITAFGKWKPEEGLSVQAFVSNVSGTGGYVLVEANDPKVVTFLPTELAALGFPSNTKPRSIVRLMGQRKRNGPFGGTYYFEREILHVPAVDPRKPSEAAATARPPKR